MLVLSSTRRLFVSTVCNDLKSTKSIIINSVKFPRNKNTISVATVTPTSNFFSTTTATMQQQQSDDYYRIAITGSSGLVGTALMDELKTNNNTIQGKPTKIIKLVRPDSSAASTPDGHTEVVQWNPYPSSENESCIELNELKNFDAIVHLAGENAATGLGPLGFLGIRPWTQEKKDLIMKSRVETTEAIAKALSKLHDLKKEGEEEEEKKQITFISAGGIGIYGSDFIGSDCKIADEFNFSDVTKDTKGFLCDVSRAWEKASSSVENNNTSDKIRLVKLRFGVVMSKLGGALEKLYPIFFLGGGGKVGSGDQYFSFISARDVARGIVHTLDDSEGKKLEGVVNVCAPNPCTNQEFTSALGKVLNRPTLIPLPAFMVKLMFGEMGDEMLLGGTRAYPKKLIDSGFEFRHPNIEDALHSAIHEEKNI